MSQITIWHDPIFFPSKPLKAKEPSRKELGWVRAIRFGVHLLQGNHAGNRLGTLHRQGDGDGDVLGLSVLGRNNAHNHGIENPALSLASPILALSWMSTACLDCSAMRIIPLTIAASTSGTRALQN